MTGTPVAYRPSGDLASGRRPAATGDLSRERKLTAT